MSIERYCGTIGVRGNRRPIQVLVARTRSVCFSVPASYLESGKGKRASRTNFGEIPRFSRHIGGNAAGRSGACARGNVRIVVDGERNGSRLRVQRIEASRACSVGTARVHPVAVFVGELNAVDSHIGSKLAI